MRTHPFRLMVLLNKSPVGKFPVKLELTRMDQSPVDLLSNICDKIARVEIEISEEAAQDIEKAIWFLKSNVINADRRIALYDCFTINNCYIVKPLLQNTKKMETSWSDVIEYPLRSLTSQIIVRKEGILELRIKVTTEDEIYVNISDIPLHWKESHLEYKGW